METSPQREFTARWEMQVTDTDPHAAARPAWEHMRRPDSIANVFTIYDHETSAATHVDLSEAEREESA
ncbi:MAG: hypothetical protein JWP48_3686 [Actinoallomurus sp.]|nr:hypothetical protein [Actinoallomurus sp.]